MRIQALAESMGIETDWNCAISLRPLEDSSQPDPHRMKSNYADWDVKVSYVLSAIDSISWKTTWRHLRFACWVRDWGECVRSSGLDWAIGVAFNRCWRE